MTVTVPKLEKIESARAAKDLFPVGCDVDKVFKALARTCHPDFAPLDLVDRATRAYQKLSEFRESLKNGSKPVKFGDWEIKGPFEKGDLCDLYLASNKGRAKDYILKIVRSERDKDLMGRERRNLELLWDVDKPRQTFLKYLPHLVDHFSASRRTAHVFEYAEGYLPLTEIQKLAGRIDFRHVVWMMNRLLSLLGYIASKGVVHGAILPQHLLYHPKTHGMILTDWCYSANVLKGEYIPAIVKGHDLFYPKEVRKKQVSFPTDLFMAARSLQTVAEIPPSFKAIFDWCLAESHKARASDPWAVHTYWTATAQKTYGDPKYVELKLRTNF